MQKIKIDPEKKKSGHILFWQ